MKPTIDDINNHFQPNDVIQHPNDPDFKCHFKDVYNIWDNGTGGWNGFTKQGIIILWSGKTGNYSNIVK